MKTFRTVLTTLVCTILFSIGFVNTAIAAAPAPNLSVPSQINCISSADFNGNKYADLAVANGNRVTIFLGNGDGTFTAQTPITFSAPVTDIESGDIDGNGKIDLVVSSGKQVIVLMGKGDGTFTKLEPINFPATVRSTALINTNGNGKMDLAVGVGKKISILFGNGDGTFSPATK